jgi:argininosuccinate lyase
MPHKKNPDVFELVRAHCNRIQGLPAEITLITNNLPSGYFRDLQLIKELFLPVFAEIKDCLRMVIQMLRDIKINENILKDDRYALLFSVEEVNRRVLSGVPFRDAYLSVGKEIESGRFKSERSVHHTHEGSIGNLCNAEIIARKLAIMSDFLFDRVKMSELNLLESIE